MIFKPEKIQHCKVFVLTIGILRQYTLINRWGNGENSTFVGPGHPCVVGDWLVYHAWLYDQISADQVAELMMHDEFEEIYPKNRRSQEGSFSLIDCYGQRRGQSMDRSLSGQGWQGAGLQTLSSQDQKQFQQ